MSTIQPSLSTNDVTFQLSDVFLVIAIIISSLCISRIVIEFCLHKKLREIPTGLMVVRAIFNYIAVILVLLTIKFRPPSLTNNSTECQLQGAVFLFCLYIATLYYGVICWELYLTLKNPFRAPSSGSIPFHIISVLLCITVVSSVALAHKFEFRSDFQICFMEQVSHHSFDINILNWCLIYIPVFGICITGIISTIWSVRRLNTGINYDTFESRMLAIKQQTAIITCFTINYILQGINWVLLFTHVLAPAGSPYFLSVFCLIACVFDALTWIMRKHIDHVPTFLLPRAITHERRGSPRSMKHYTELTFTTRSIPEIKKISATLRREVITCIIDGLSRKNTKNTAITVMDNGDKRSTLKVMIEKEDRSAMDLLSLEGYYPRNIDDKCAKGMIEQYTVDPIQVNRDQALFTNYAPKVFSYLRSVYGVDDQVYYNSIRPMDDADDVSKIALEISANFSEGRSGAFLFFTKDKKFLIKTLSKNEAQLLLDTLVHYVAYMTYNKSTYLLKHFGLHSIKLYGQSIYFVVNNNIFAVLDKEPDEKYDIKGSWIDRNTNHRIEDKQLMKDKDLKKPMLVERDKGNKIYEQLKKDVAFLTDLYIMDYSLLLGVYYTKVKVPHDDDVKYNDEQEDELTSVLPAEVVEGAGKYCIGIIDMLQKWDTNKKAERFAKSYIRCKDKHGISCVPPKEYSHRFLLKMKEIGIGYDVD